MAEFVAFLESGFVLKRSFENVDSVFCRVFSGAVRMSASFFLFVRLGARFSWRDGFRWFNCGRRGFWRKRLYLDERVVLIEECGKVVGVFYFLGDKLRFFFFRELSFV